MYINFELLKKANPDHNILFNSLINYSLNLNSYIDLELKETVKFLLAFTRAYNIISSIKYVLKNFLQLAMVYANFRYFHIPQYISSTGRVFSRPYFITFQEHKVIRPFLEFADG